MSTKEIVNVEGIDVTIQNVDSHRYISLTDIAKKKNSEEPRFVVINGLEIVTPLNSWEYGKKFTILILTVSDLIRLECKQV